MYKEPLREAYNRMARERDRSELQDWKINERSRFLSKLQEEKRGRLLEIGAGTGRDSLFFQEAGLQVTAADLSEEMAALCREKGLDARIMDFYRLDFAKATFDAVYALNCLLHVPKKICRTFWRKSAGLSSREGCSSWGCTAGWIRMGFGRRIRTSPNDTSPCTRMTNWQQSWRRYSRWKNSARCILAREPRISNP
ncbi:class I SAM-dependent methyltransferase [Paenibacillus sp. CC-CFT747]|nr:class I SAM-dependent methyltransferase [Paenibacillus sp. CC-CFT747]